jgi:diphthine-ammonia ligase
MKFFALLSGGKDSCYNIIKSIEYGHELVCLANLSPERCDDELNSYMYQTAGHNIVPTIAECFGVPLFRRTITGNLCFHQ